MLEVVNKIKIQDMKFYYDTEEAPYEQSKIEVMLKELVEGFPYIVQNKELTAFITKEI